MLYRPDNWEITAGHEDLKQHDTETTADEMKTLSALFDKQLADYQKDPAAAEALLQTGAATVPAALNKTDLAAWTHVARVLLNLHETVTRS